MTEMIPISEIDSLIAEIEDTIKHIKPRDYPELLHNMRCALGFLERLQEKAIPAIPISKIDAKIKELRETPDQFGSSIYYYHSEVIKRVCEELEDLKKE